MSELFDAGLRDLYAAVEREHDARPGLSVAAMVARTRRRRRVRGAGFGLATAAVVAGVAVAGSAVVRGLDGAPVPTAPPATEATQDPDGTRNALVEPTCGTELDDLAAFPVDPGVVLEAGLDADTLVAGELDAWFGTTVLPGPDHPVSVEAQVPGDVGFVVTRDGVVVGTAERGLRPAPPEEGSPRSHDAQVWPVACDGGPMHAPLAPGTYDLVAYLPAVARADDDEGTPAVLLSEPVPFTVPDAGPLPAADAHLPVDGASDAPPASRSAPVPDGEYLGHLSGVDGAAGIVAADLVTIYTGRAAEEWLAVNRPGEDAYDGYTTDDPDGPDPRTLPLAADAAVWEWCSTETQMTIARRGGGVAEWAAAPAGETFDRMCSEGPTMSRGGTYWFDVRGGVVVQVVGQFLP